MTGITSSLLAESIKLLVTSQATLTRPPSTSTTHVIPLPLAATRSHTSAVEGTLVWALAKDKQTLGFAHIITLLLYHLNTRESDWNELGAHPVGCGHMDQGWHVN